MSGYRNYYDTTFGRTANKKKDDDKSTTSRIASKYGNSYASNSYQRDSSAGRTTPSRVKSILDKKDTSHPPVSFRPISRTGARSRDPSPVDKLIEKSNYDYNKLYSKPYTSRERTESTSSSTSTIPKYTGRTSITRDDIPKYSGRSSITKDDSLSRYKVNSRGTSREDLSSSGAQKYISSRFLPKNSVEKSFTAYARPSTVRANETSRKNRELLNVLHAQQEQERLSRPASRCSSVAPEDVSKDNSNIIVNDMNTAPSSTSSSKTEDYSNIEMESVTVITRSTSPTPTNQHPSFLRRRMEIAKVVEKQILRPKTKFLTMVDKEIQSDRLDDSTRSSRFVGASRISATPWTSILDMKFSSPNSKVSGSTDETPTSKTDSSIKDKNQVRTPAKIKKSPSPVSSSSTASNSSSTKSKIATPKQNDKKQLPPQIPKSEKTVHSSVSTQNKDFRKSVLNMNPEGKLKKKLGRRSNSASSAESEVDPEATDISENLTSCKSYHSSKLPQKISLDKNARSRRSPSSDASTSSATTVTSSSEDDLGKKCENTHRSSSRTSVILSSADELSTDKSPKPPMSPRPKSDKTEAEAKSFLMRALAPVTNLFKSKHESPEKSLENIAKNCKQDSPVDSKPVKIVLHRVESGEKPWWQEEKLQSQQDSPKCKSPKMHRVESGEAAWWLDPNSEIPEGVQVYSKYVSEESTPDGQKIYRILSPDDTNRDGKIVFRRVESGEKPWWLESNSEKSTEEVKSSFYEDDGKKIFKLYSSEESPSEGKPVKLVLHRVESGEKPWWLDSNSTKAPEGVEIYPSCDTQDNTRYTYKKRANDSEESSWWLNSSENSKSTDSKTAESERIYRRPESNESSWWLDSKSSSESKQPGNSNNINNNSNFMENEYLEKHKIRHIDSGERAWWMSSNENLSQMVEAKEEAIKPKYAIRHQDSGEKPWWLQSSPSNTKESDESDHEIPLGDRASPEGLEMPKDDDEGRLSPYDNVPATINTSSAAMKQRQKPANLFISKHRNIDEILGGQTQLWSPIMDRIFGYGEDEMSKQTECTEIDAEQVKIHDSTPQRGVIQPNRIDNLGGFPKAFSNLRLDDAALQLYKDGDYGSYLDLEASISEQQEEFEGFQSNKKNSIVLRTQLSVRVHTIIEKLSTSEGRELRRALFSLKQIFQEDKDLVHEFVQNDGLSCLIKVGSEADQNYQNYILRALGQVMLYVDGMNGVIEHNQTIQWLYSLISSKFRLVVKTALKLLLVFVEYIDSNCMLLIKAIHTVDYQLGLLPYHNIMKLLKDFDSADTELLIYAMTLVNKVLNGVPDQDTYYDQTDALEEQGIEQIIQRYMSKPGTDLDLLQQFQIYEAVLQYEDGEEIGTPIRHLDENIRKTIRNRKSMVDSNDRRKSRRHSTGTTPLYGGINRHNIINNNNNVLQVNKEDDDESSSSQSSDINSQLNGSYKDCNKGNYTNALQQRIANGNLNRNSSRKDLTPLLNAVNKLDSEEALKQPWILSMIQNQENMEENESANENERNLLLQLKRENTVKDLTQKLANQNILHSPSDENNKLNRIGDMSGLISKAKEGLAKSKSKADLIKSPTTENVPKIEVKKSENELRWEELASNLNRPLNLCDMDFTDLATDDETDILAPATVPNGIPPPPPPLNPLGSAPPPPPLSNSRIPPPVPNPPVFGINLRTNKNETKIPIKKTKKTVKLFWKEVRDDPIASVKLKTGFIWDELSPVTVDTQKLEHLFESRAKDLITKKQQEMNKNKEIIVLDPKRSNAINIGMTKLPPPRSIKTAILKMDATIMNREGIEKLLTMLPTEEERTKIQEAQAANPDLPLGSAEQFLLTLASISELPARLKLWAFKLDFENSEREIAEPLMDLKQGVEVLKINKTFRGILSTLLSIGNFLNGNEVKGFQIEYLAKVPEVKDTVHKHSLLHHLCHIVMEKFPDATDLYSEIGAITRASKIDFDELALNIQRLEADCKASWDHLKLIAKHDGSTMMKVKMSDFLSDCAERIILLGIIHRRILNRFHKFLLWLGIPLHQIADTKPNEFCRIVSEFALEYRTTRERVLQQLEKKANHRERNKTRGKMITDIGKFRTKEDRADAELRQLLGSDISDVESMQGTLPWRRTRRESARSFLSQANGNLTDGDDEILESLVKTATKGPSRTAPRERKRTRHADRKSLKRSRTRENNPFGSRDSP